MPLEEYRRKRDFAVTREPRGEGSSATPGAPQALRRYLRRFVVQRHRASRLHHDFRLEIDDVLVSWAVPRGPSMRPLTRRRASRTEDHPIDYMDFEGVIPAGEYGAGDVIVWDQGTWQPEDHTDPAVAVAAGELKLILYGQRLRGRFVIVRTGTDGRSREDWLLIHKRDEHADPDWDIDDHPTSVLSGLTNEEVAEGRDPAHERPSEHRPPDADLARARSAALPGFIEPMLATTVDRPFSGADWLFELKLDGYRLQAIIEAGSARLRTRNGKDGASYFPAFATMAASWIEAGEAVVDGEMVALDEAGRPSFSLLQDLAGMHGLGVQRGERLPSSRGDVTTGPIVDDGPKGRLIYHAFDLLHLDGWSLVDVPLETRKALLRAVLREHPSVRFVSHVLEHGEELQRAVVAQGLEGSLAKLRRSVYEPGKRSRSWLKIKSRREAELVVIGYEPGQGRHQDLGALLVATFDADDWRFAGEVGSGLDGPTRRMLRTTLDELARPEPPSSSIPRIPEVRWSEPRLVIRAEFAEWTTDGLLRQAAFKGLEVGRDPVTVSRERVESTDAVTSPRPGRRSRVRQPPGSGGTARTAEDTVTTDELAALEAMPDGGRWQVGGHEVDLSNLDKVLFPAAGYTKRDLIRYYTSIAPVILPYLRDRPLNVHRWPDGVTGRTQFWQKQIPSHAPAWVARWDYPEAGREQSHTYVVADRVATMAWLANQAVIDLHPWTSRLPEYWRPTYAYVDIDPGERTTWAEVLTLARLYRTALGHLGVVGYPKVTGKRGIQIWIAVLPRYTFDQTRDWVGELSRGVGAVVPDLVSWEWGKADRGGRARLDYTQNSFIKTLVAPYAVRPVPSAAVSAPIGWDELDDTDLRPDGWDIQTIMARVETMGDLFSGVLDDPQVLPPLS
jgi:bifunctional non-homologous end joining protein LigD